MHRVKVDASSSASNPDGLQFTFRSVQAKINAEGPRLQQKRRDPPSPLPRRCYGKCSLAGTPLEHWITGGGSPMSLSDRKRVQASVHAQQKMHKSQRKESATCRSPPPPPLWASSSPLSQASGADREARFHSTVVTRKSDPVWAAGCEISPGEKLRLIKQVCKIDSFTTTECQVVGLKTSVGKLWMFFLLKLWIVGFFFLIHNIWCVEKCTCVKGKNIAQNERHFSLKVIGGSLDWPRWCPVMFRRREWSCSARLVVTCSTF